MLIASGIVFVLFGLVGVVGQLISTVNFELAQKLGLQEKDAETEPLFRRLELNTARWDLFVIWTLPLAGVLMLIDHSGWPYLSLVAGGVHVDTAGREAAKLLGLKAQGIRIGADKEVRLALFFFGVMAAIGVWAIVYGLVSLK